MHSRPILDMMNPIRPTQAETRAAALLREQHQLDTRRAELEEQTSSHNSPAQRIEIWERLHALQLPRDAAHPLLSAIARQTRLPLADVLSEQQRRKAGPQNSPEHRDDL